MLNLKSKKAIAPLLIILILILALIGIYLFLFIPIPAFKKIRAIINYFLIIIFWIVLQVGLIFAYYKLGSFAVKGFKILKMKVVSGSIKVHKLIAFHT